MKLTDVAKNRPILIAEISANHNGDLERAKSLIRLAAKHGADLVKTQTYDAESMTIDGPQAHFKIKSGPWAGQTYFELYSKAATPLRWQPELFEFAKIEGILLFSTPFSDEGVDILEQVECPFYKIASFELTDHQLVRKIAETGKDTILSTGTASWEEIQEAVATFKSISTGELILLHANSAYPSPVEEANLSVIPRLINEFGLRAGLSDHSLGTLSPVIATSLGASVIEKHFTDSRTVESPDSFFSSEPSEFLQIRQEIEIVAKSLGDGELRRPKSEQLSLQYRRSLMYLKDLPEGAVLTIGDLGRFRPGGGLPVAKLAELIGRKLARAVNRGDFVTASDFDTN